MKMSKIVSWIATSIAVSIAIYITKDADCLWAFTFPFLASIYGE